MISRGGKEGFLAAHYDWLAFGAGLLALAGAAAYYAMASGGDADAAADDAAAKVAAMRPAETGVKPVEMEAMKHALRLTRTPPQMTELPEAAENFMSSERRVLCQKCKHAIPGSAKVCPVKECGAEQEEKQKVVLDADGDGMPDEWEKKYGLNPADPSDANTDLDGDGFTNLEEYLAKTDPTDRRDHPDYLDSLTLSLPLKETFMPFVFTEARKIPAGWRCNFFDASLKDDYGRAGRMLSAIVGEEIGDSGYVLKGYERKQIKRIIKGSENLTRHVDVSEAELERKSDGKRIKMVISLNTKARPMAVDVQATLVYTRGTVQNFDVIAGSEISLNGEKYKVVEVKSSGNGAKVTLEHLITGKRRTIGSLDQ